MNIIYNVVKGDNMTQVEISKTLDIPFATLNDWKQTNSNRNKLYELLINLDKSLVDDIFDKKNNHRFFHILNRNIDDVKFTYDDIRKAFLKKDYHEATLKEQTIFSKFFKELDIDELEDFVKVFNLSKRNIKNIYISSPFRSIVGVAKKWDKRFRLKHIQSNQNFKQTLPFVLQNILNKKSLSV